MRSFFAGWIAFFLVIGLAITSTAFAGEPAPKMLKVGSTQAFNLSTGIEMKKYFDVIVGDLNAKGGITIGGERYLIDLTIYDDGYKADKGRAAFERLVYQDKVKFIAGQHGSALTIAGLAVTEPNKIPVFASCVTNMLFDPKNRYTVRPSNISTGMAGQRVLLLKKFPNIKTSIYIGPDDETGKDSDLQDKRICQALGIKKLGTIFIPRESKDYISVGLKVKSFNPDLVYLSGINQGSPLGGVLKSLYQAGYKGVRLGVTPDMEVVKTIAGKEGVEGYIAAFRDGSAVPNPGPVALQLRQMYTAKYGKWDDSAVMWINSWYGFIAALKKANSLDPDKVMAAIANLEFEAPQGRFVMVKRPDLGAQRFCDAASEMYLGQVHNGELEYMATLSANDAVAAAEKVFGGGNWK